MSMHKQPLTEIERNGLIAHHLETEKPSQLSDCFRQGIAWLENSLNDWQCIGQNQPTDEKAVYWVVGGEAGKEPILARFNDYKSLGGRTNYWQTLSHDDFSMIGTKWLKVEKPTLQKG